MQLPVTDDSSSPHHLLGRNRLDMQFAVANPFSMRRVETTLQIACSVRCLSDRMVASMAGLAPKINAVVP
jgi:hypothetical protein